MKETFHLQETLDESTISMDMMPEDEEMEDNDNKEESSDGESDDAAEEEESGGDDDKESCGYGPWDHTGPSVGDCLGNCGGYICDHCFNIHDCTECGVRDFLWKSASTNFNAIKKQLLYRHKISHLRATATKHFPDLIKEKKSEAENFYLQCFEGSDKP